MSVWVLELGLPHRDSRHINWNCGKMMEMAMETSTLDSSGHGMLSGSMNEAASLESDTSADELALDSLLVGGKT